MFTKLFEYYLKYPIVIHLRKINMSKSLFLNQPYSKMPEYSKSKAFSSNTYHFIYKEFYNNKEILNLLHEEIKKQREEILKTMEEQQIVTHVKNKKTELVMKPVYTKPLSITVITSHHK